MKPEAFAGELSRLHAQDGVFAILGNHDWWFNGEKMREFFAHEKIRVLENESVQLKFNNKTFYVAGLADFWTRKADIPKALADVPSDQPVILMSHNPDVFPQVLPRVSLTVAGHTHGGQVSLPLVGALIVPSEYGNRYAQHEVIEDGKHMFVATGIGTSVLPIRFLLPPEISFVILKAEHTLGK
ncbi:MAG: metallophosphoesterase [Terriglobales bacterium]